MCQSRANIELLHMSQVVDNEMSFKLKQDLMLNELKHLHVEGEKENEFDAIKESADMDSSDESESNISLKRCRVLGLLPPRGRDDDPFPKRRKLDSVTLRKNISSGASTLAREMKKMKNASF